MSSRGPGIDRTPQNLLVGEIRPDAVRQRRMVPRWLKFWRRNVSRMVTLAGLGLAVAGALVVALQPPVPVYFTAGTIRVGNNVLTAAGPGPVANSTVYLGSATVVLVEPGDGTARAAAVTQIGGKPVSGVCKLDEPSATQAHETCTFVIGDTTLTSVDTLDSSGGGVWHRTYSDGRTASIGVPSDGSAIPVPFPVGH